MNFCGIQRDVDEGFIRFLFSYGFFPTCPRDCDEVRASDAKLGESPIGTLGDEVREAMVKSSCE